MVSNTTFNNIYVISWWSVLLLRYSFTFKYMHIIALVSECHCGLMIYTYSPGMHMYA